MTIILNFNHTFQNVYKSLKEDGTFIFDIDSLYKMNVILKDYHEKEEDNDFVFEWKVDLLSEGYVHHYVYIEDKIENGTLREVPCNVGDTIYFDTYRRGDSIGVQPHKVARVRFVVGIEATPGNLGADIPEYEFGKSVFFTAEEAEAKLKKVMEEIK